MKTDKFIFTDRPELSALLEPYSKQIGAEIVSLEEVLERTEDLESSSKFKKVIFYLKSESLIQNHKRIRHFLMKDLSIISLIIINAPLGEDVLSQTDLENDLFYTNINDDAPAVFAAKTIVNAFAHLQLRVESFELQYKVNLSTSHISKLTRIGVSLATEKDYTKLLRDILFSAREICASDGGSLYLVERDEKGNPKNLRFKISALDLNSSEFILPINKQSIAGYVAYTGKVLNLTDVYNLDPNVEFRFNGEFDKIKNYYSKSMLVVPMKNHRGEVIGVIQLINRKKNFHQKLTLEQMKGSEVIAFDKYSEELVMSVAGQAAVAIQNNNLIQEIETLFEGFVTAAVSAIEARDPTTSGHSFRVADLTVGLAEVVDRLDTGLFREISFNSEQMKEIRYASLLHDFGKVGVREKVLVKAKKLESYELDIIRWRFHYILKDIEYRTAQKKLEYLKKNGSEGFFEYELSLDLEHSQQSEKLKEWLNIIVRCNEPTILEEASSQVLLDIAKNNYRFMDGNVQPLLTADELNYLSIKKGSLDFVERKEIESHVEHTFQFLSKIPWTPGLKMVPSIAHAHHEKLDGTGYPRGLVSFEIPVQSKMMTISDIFDALTDKDRPYKKAVPLERALDILKMEVKDEHVDGELLNIFIEAKVYERLSGKSVQPF
ncbi:MAG TPA: HD domain-containing phosphohydrolase [Leptospiraceae bacterium]|nr:HD domain-containing phosphohydrolase [Leptospiraceae bacterium]HMZ58446.1 HD domain-containing phosphohydrolase [Leptospiraceae bacterium]HNF16224.1 HD domain-containing phosphohydrolase [Leptospiraceae bacterium]HNM01739.1 HD domain-containing phosphohydrolase [Leptospiraceae bacterium]HNN03830.1 HD domain-containing phosphohydrolase [Leptospiraceae bacterium]